MEHHALDSTGRRATYPNRCVIWSIRPGWSRALRW